MILQIVRYIVALVFGVVATAAFAGIRNTRKNIFGLSIVSLGILLLQLVFLILMGLDQTLALYPIHTHLILIVFLIFHFECTCLDAVIYTLLAYMCCQIPAWVSKLAIYTPFNSGGLELTIYIVTVCATLYLICRFAAKPVHELVQSSTRSAIAFSLVPVTYYLFDYVTTVWTQLLYTGNYHITQFMPLIVCVSYLIFAVIYNKEQKKRVQSNEERTMLENELYNVENEIESLSELEHKTRIYRHDMRHHLSLLLMYLEEDQIKEAKTYIQENLKTIDSFTPKRYCDMQILNLLLSHFAGRAEEIGASYHPDIKLPDHLPLSNMEICTLVSNALENAFDATENVPVGRRMVDVRIQEFQEQLVISIDNSCNNDIVIIDNLPQASRTGHGYGTKSIQSIAKVHGGMALFQVKEEIFSLMVTIPLHNITV